MKPYENHKGYLKIGLFKDGKCEKHRVHRLVAQAFIPNPYGLSDVNHIDGNKQNNSVSNLEWVSNRDNVEYSKYMMAKLLSAEGNSVDETIIGTSCQICDSFIPIINTKDGYSRICDECKKRLKKLLYESSKEK
jgi:hypothetical protein